MEIRTAALQDLDAVAAVEAACFPAVAAATKEEFAERLRYSGTPLWLTFAGGTLIGRVARTAPRPCRRYAGTLLTPKIICHAPRSL